jgi:NAD+ synthase
MALAPLSIVMAQINPVVGDLEGNTALIRAIWAEHAQADLIVFPELVVTGYPPEDLLLKPSFIKAITAYVDILVQESASHDAGILISAPWQIEGALYNAALLIAGGELIAVRAKYNIPNYGVFDEKRFFTAGALPKPVDYRGHKLGVMTCEDMWNQDVSTHLKQHGADILLCLNASPFQEDKHELRLERARACVEATSLPLIYVNMVGGQDELVFDGGSFVLSERGEITMLMPFFTEHASLVSDSITPLPCTEERLYRAAVLGLRDYVEKNGFAGVLLGLSGGIDSALSAVIAADAIGVERVRCVMMPSRYTSQDSLEDAQDLANNLGISLESISIELPVEAFESVLPKDAPSVTFENIQSRSRGLILMALSNAGGYMVLSTGNKSEMAVGYATLYGDMCGGFNALKDLYKGQVYAISRWVNREREIIPARTITKAPTAELRPDQTDQDSLPPYELLDAILECIIEHEMGVADMVNAGHDEATVRRIIDMVNRAEYKRRQAPPGVKVTRRAFGRDRRYPITNKFIEKSR